MLASRQVLLLLFPFSISGLSLTRSALGSLPLALSLGSLVVPGSQGARQQAGGAPATHAPFPQVWQHCDCMGVHADVEHYLCERCEPRPVDRVSRPLRPAASALAPFDAALSPSPPRLSFSALRGGAWAVGTAAPHAAHFLQRHRLPVHRAARAALGSESGRFPGGSAAV